MKNWIIWVLAFIITIGAAIYQKKTGPTYPKTEKITLNGTEYKISMLRSLDHDNKARLRVPLYDSNSKVMVIFHRYLVNEPYDTIVFQKTAGTKHRGFLLSLLLGKNKFEKEHLTAILPDQPPAGKLQYYLVFENNNQIIELRKENPVIIRFKGEVPGRVLIPHIFIMFFAMFLSNIAGLMAIFKKKQFWRYTILTFIFIIIGGLWLGPVVQKYAFGEYWTGIPFGWDLTDNKTLYAIIFWLIALLGSLRKRRAWLTILAAVMMLVVFSIPHSMFGSQLNYTTGSISTGK
jgi:hypothetical protein